MKSRDHNNLRYGLLFASPWLIGFTVFTLYPVLASLYYSFCDYSVLQSPVFIGVENYQRLAHDSVFWLSLRNTLFYAALSIPLGMVAALSLALLLNSGVRGMPLFRTIFYLPSIVPAVAGSMLWMWILNGQYGLLNWAIGPLFHLFGTTPPSWLGDPQWAKPALVLMSLWGVGNSMIIYLAGLQDVPQELYESAELDGASWFGRLWHVTLPLISPVIYFNVVMGIIGALQVFSTVFVMTAGGPARATLFYALYLFNTAFFDLRMGYASAMAWVMFLLIVGLTLTVTKISEKRIHYSS